VLLAGAVQVVDRQITRMQVGLGWSKWVLVETPDAPVWVLWSVVAVLAVFRLRRTAAVGAWIATAGFVVAAWFGMGWFWENAVYYSGWLMLGAVVAAALTWSPGPARGRRLVGGRRFTVLVVAVVASAVLVRESIGQYGLVSWPLEHLALIGGGAHLGVWFLALAVLVAGALVAADPRTREGRRAALLLSVPVVVSVLMLAVPNDARLMLMMAVCYGVPVVVLLGLGGLPHRVRRAG
jgi:hypothetical protein